MIAHIPVARPQLPQAEALLPYLRKIDTSRTYTNHGPLAAEFERRIAECLDLGERQTLACANGTMALTSAILAMRLRSPAKRICLMPGYCFVAAAAAASTCGYECHLVDVDRRSWSLDPIALRRHPFLGDAGLVLVVAPYGRIPDLAGWDAFYRETGIPVVVDAAASLDIFIESGIALPPSVPVALSLHATKSFGCGEGGLLLTSDPAFAEDAFRYINFGYLEERVATRPGLNGKMSEYHAAVALAELDGFEQKRARWRQIGASYRAALSGLAGNPRGALWCNPDVSGCYALYEGASAGQTAALRQRLMSRDIETRFWYGGGIASQPAYRSLARDPLPVTEDLGARLIGLPCFIDLEQATIEAIAAEMAVW